MARAISLLVLLLAAAGAAAQDNAALAAGALAALEAKCALCHGPQLERPKGRFGFVTDLPRLAQEPDFVVPGQPQDSYLWTQIASGEMPPGKSRAGPLTPVERDAILAWIKGGAPVPVVTRSSDPAPTGARDTVTRQAQPEPDPRATAASSPTLRTLEFIGRFHILIIHFPIALLIAAASAEAWAATTGHKVPLPSVRFCLTLGAVSAVVAGGFGWLHAVNDWGRLWSNLWFHRWIGTAAAVVAPAVAVLSERDVRRGARTKLTRAAILIAAVLVGVAGHFGGLVTYGSGFFTP